jgi:L-fuculose-phosphate aldolase
LTDNDALRQDVATANRILERFGLSHAFGHASARIPGTNTFLLPTRRSPGLADAADLLVIDTEGRVVSGDGEPNSEFWIHARMYAAREDVGGVVHAHPPACVCLTQIGEPYRVVHNQGAIFSAGVPEYSRVGLIRSRELGDLLAKVIGAGKAAMMRGHGITTAFGDVRTATVAACYLEESAALQLRMLSATGGDAARLRVFSAEEAGPLADQIAGSVARRAWEYFAAVAAANPLGSGQK